MITHGNVISACAGVRDTLQLDISTGLCHLAYLPLAVCRILGFFLTGQPNSHLKKKTTAHFRILRRALYCGIGR